MFIGRGCERRHAKLVVSMGVEGSSPITRLTIAYYSGDNKDPCKGHSACRQRVEGGLLAGLRVGFRNPEPLNP